MFHLTVDDEINLCLREERHVEELFALVDANRIHLREWLPWLDANTSPADSRQFIKKGLQQFSANNGGPLAIEFRGQFVGMTGYHFIDWDNKAVEIGYWLSAEAQGQGIMSRTTQFLVNHAFTELKLNRVVIRCAARNHKSRAIPERLGFTNEGALRQAVWLYDHFIDLVVYSMLAEEWQMA